MVKTFDVFGVRISCISQNSLNEYIGNVIREKRKEPVLNVNVHCLNLISRISWMKDFFKQSPLVFCDGDGVRLLSLWSKNKIPEKITYNRWIWSLLSYCEEHGFSVYFLGDKERVVSKAVECAMRKNPRLNIKGYHHGFIKGFEERVVQEINRHMPNILILGMGMPIQEKFIIDYGSVINTNIFLNGGAVFSYMSGMIKTTPNLFFRLKLEWFYRFLQEPKRLFVRYFYGIPRFYVRYLIFLFFQK